MTVNKVYSKKPFDIEGNCNKDEDLLKANANENSKLDVGLYNLWIRSILILCCFYRIKFME